MSELQTNSANASSQADYEPTAYEDSSWEVVGELVETKEFTPMPVNILPATNKYMDPMFADYGGIPNNPEAQRWHLPDELLVSERKKNTTSEDTEEVARISLTDEELNAIKQESFQAGQVAGIEESAIQSNERFAAIETKMSALISDLSKQHTEHMQLIEQRAVQISLQIAYKLTHNVVEINPEYILPIIKAGLGLTANARVKQVRVSHQDLEFIQLMGLAKTLKDREDQWEFIADESIKAGCILETSAGEIDFDIDQAYSRIKDQVLRIVK